jgi:drug/metabolite transporter (DMT)-like permease
MRATRRTPTRPAGDAGGSAKPPPAEARTLAAFEPLDWGLLAASALMWGSSFLLIEIGLRDLHPATVAFLRILFGALTLAALPAARRAVPRTALPAVAILGVVWMGIPFLLFPVAQQWIDSSLAGMLNGAAPLFTAAVAIFAFRRRLGWPQLAGLVLGFAGVVAISWPAVQSAEATAFGAVLILLATILYGIAFNLAEPLEQRHGALPVILRAQLAALVLVAPFGLAGLAGSSLTASGLLSMVGLGSLGTGLAFVAFVTLVGKVGAPRGSVTVYFIPIVAIGLGVIFLGESVALASVIGTGLAIAGAYLTSRGQERTGR